MYWIVLNYMHADFIKNHKMSPCSSGKLPITSGDKYDKYLKVIK